VGNESDDAHRRASASVPRFLFVMYYPERFGGAERFLWDVLRHLDRSRCAPSVVFLKDGPFVQEVAGLGIPTTVIQVGRYRNVLHNIASIARLARFLRRERPDLVVNWTAEGQLFAGTAAAFVGMRRRVVWWNHAYEWLNPIVMRIPAVAIGCSSHAMMRGTRPRRRRQCFVVWPGVEEPSQRDPAEIARLRESLAIAADAAVLGLVGRMHPQKAQDRFVEALALLRSDGHDVHGLIVGGTSHGIAPEYARLVERRVRELGLESVVTFTGQISNVDPYLDLMNVFVNARANEPFGIAIIEAMAHGVPVVAVRGEGPSEIIAAGRSGILADSNDPRALADAIEPLLVSGELRQHLAEGARERFRKHFTCERMARELEDRLLAVAMDVRLA
jgi:glycosyltransferase involved in cell wall biosynthesis